MGLDEIRNGLVRLWRSVGVIQTVTGLGNDGRFESRSLLEVGLRECDDVGGFALDGGGVGAVATTEGDITI